MSGSVASEVSQGICVLTLVAPEMRNAISVEMRIALRDLAAAALADPEVRVLIIAGQGDHFCSGGQIKPDLKPSPERTRANIAILHDIVRLFVAGAKPVIAAVEGCAFGAGLSLVAACDYVVAGEGAKFCASFGKVGLMADAGLAWTLGQRVGQGHARDLLLTGRTFHAEEALRLGFANRVVPSGGALAEARVVAGGLMAVAPLSVAALKRVLHAHSASLDDVLAAELEIQPELTVSRDYAEGRAAFREKRAAVFVGA